MFEDIYSKDPEDLINEAIKKYHPEVMRDEKGRFKPGFSGNKKGRPVKNLNNIKDILNDILKNKTALTISGKNKQANLLMALIYKLIVELLQNGTPYQIIKFLMTFKSYIDPINSDNGRQNINNEDLESFNNSPNPQDITKLIYEVMDDRYGINRIPNEIVNQEEENNDNN